MSRKDGDRATGGIGSVRYGRWIFLVAATVITFMACVFLARSLKSSILPRDEGDLWEFSTAFASAVSAAVIAALAWWASRPRDRASADSDEYSKEVTVASGTDLGGDLSATVERSWNRRFIEPFRVSALTVGVLANIVVILGLVGGVSNGPLYVATVVAVAIGILSLYLAYISGVLIREGRATGWVCMVGWLVMGLALLWMHLIEISQKDHYLAFDSQPSRQDIHPESIMLFVIYFATGLAVMVNPKKDRRDSIVRKSA